MQPALKNLGTEQNDLQASAVDLFGGCQRCEKAAGKKEEADPRYLPGHNSRSGRIRAVASDRDSSGRIATLSRRNPRAIWYRILNPRSLRCGRALYVDEFPLHS